MTGLFLILATCCLAIGALLLCAPDKKLLNFVDYGDAGATARLNRRAAAGMLLPLSVNLGCAFLAARHPALSVPLVFLTPLSILAAVVWISAGAPRRRS